ncbi:hypothetical protein HIM_10875 [Hirsutella minnesotensis 3608]|uniref:Uncharacterized protein n=1 Tax=Hirsutella minnesotensis 3608 TaxID=1043627 RepID=A0A0F7ZJL4_9HYPO|nr:hypothetical protein HIM_10875 [Hirsutella minnesotensis 3608]
MLACAVALGQVRVVGMRKRERAALIHELEVKKDQLPLGSQVLRSLATRHNVPREAQDEKIYDEGQNNPDQAAGEEASANQPSEWRDNKNADDAVCGTTSQSGGHLTSECETHTIHDRNPKDLNTHTGQGEVIEYASQAGVTIIFDEYVCDAIRTIPIQSNGVTSWKASVTMVFPVWAGLVDCMMSLDVHDWGVKYFAMALFNAKVEWVEDVRHIVLKEGTTLIIPSAEATLKGAQDEAIMKVFGSEIYRAVTESPVRKKELRERKSTTDCVSMILTKNGAIVNLSLGLDKGLEIQKKLNAQR